MAFNQQQHHYPSLILLSILLLYNIIMVESSSFDNNKCLGANIVARGSIRKPDGPQITLFHFNDIPSITNNKDDIPFMLYASVLSVSEGPYWSPALLPQGLSCLSYNDTITEGLFPFKDSLNTTTTLPTKFKLFNNISAIVLHSADVESATGMPLSRLISELAAKYDITDVRQKYGCQRLLSYTQTEKGVTILAESCTLLSPMCELKHINGPTQTCALKYNKREITGTGSHRQLYASIKGQSSLDGLVALEWLPAELFVDPDELYDNNMFNNTYPLTKVDIEVASFMNYPLAVITNKYPIPVHIRYTRPDCQKPFEYNKSIIDKQRCDGYYRAWITSPIWLLHNNNTLSSSSCAAEGNNIYNELNINGGINNILFNNTLIPLCVIPSHPLDVSIPSGNSNIMTYFTLLYNKVTTTPTPPLTVCEICCEGYGTINRRPMILVNCGHTICEMCLDSLIAHSLDDPSSNNNIEYDNNAGINNKLSLETSTIRCPFCREHTEIAAIRPNYILIQNNNQQQIGSRNIISDNNNKRISSSTSISICNRFINSINTYLPVKELCCDFKRNKPP